MSPMNEIRDVHEIDRPNDDFKTEEKLEQAVQESKMGVRPYLSSRKERLVEQLNNTARVLEDSSSQLNDTRSSGLIRITAEKIDKLGNYLGSHGVDEIFDDFQDYARSQPLVVLGGAFVAGLAAVRFLKASERTSIEQ
jgi:hypothetical protein